MIETFAFDWVMSVLGVLLVAGVFQDGWAHNHGRVDQSFFTPWHAVLYGIMALNGFVLGAVAVYNRFVRKLLLRDALPFAYWPALIGVCIFALGGVFDLWWHTKFGIEEDLQALVSPSHLLLAAGASLILTAPLRSVASRVDTDAGGWLRIGPALLSCIAMMGVIGFFTVYTNPNGNDYVRHIIGRSASAPVTAALYTMRDDGTRTAAVVSQSDANAYTPAIAPDGKTIAYTRSPLDSSTGEIVVASVDGSHTRAVVSDGRLDLYPSFSPDGRRIAYVSAPAGTSGNFRLMVTGIHGGKPQTLADQTATLSHPSWTPDGKSIVVTSRNGVDPQIARVDVASKQLQFVEGTANGGYPAVSPDGKTLAFVEIAGRRSRIATVPLGGGSPRIVVQNAFASPVWSPDGSHIAYTALVGDDSTLRIVDTRNGTVRDLSRLSGFGTSHPSWSRNHVIVFSARPNPPETRTQIATYFVESNNLVNALILSGFGLLLVRRFTVPFGALTLLFTLYGAMMATQEDTYFVIPVLFATGLISDVCVAILRQRIRQGLWFYALGSAMPLLYFAFFIAAANATVGLDWASNLVTGSPILAGIVGLFVAFCFDPPLAVRHETA